MRVAYADPPYLGMAKRHYGHDPNAREVNHRLLIGYLDSHFDSWALSTHEPGLRVLLPMCPDGVRVMPWVKPFCSFKPSVGVAYAWEPVIVKIHRKRTREQQTVRDWVAANITMRRGLAGAKPYAFCAWLFDVLNMEPPDMFEDVFPGTGAVSEAWEAWRSRFSMRPQAGDLFASPP